MKTARTFPLNVPQIGRVRVCLETIEEIDIKGKVVVNVGCSFGWLERELADKDVDLIGLDPNKSAIEFAIKHKPKRVRYLVGDALAIPLENNSVDVVLFSDVIEHLPSGAEQQALAEIARVLKKEGVIFLSTPNANLIAKLTDPAWYFGHRHYSYSRLETLLRTQRFKIRKHFIRGDFIAAIYTIWFYLVKRLFSSSHPRNYFLEHLSDLSYQKNGYIEHFLIAEKL